MAGHDLKPIERLVDEVIDLTCRVGRVEADFAGVAYDRDAEVKRDPRSWAVCAVHAEQVRATADRVKAAIILLAPAGKYPTFKSVAKALTDSGHPITARTIRRQVAYSRPILEFHGIAPPMTARSRWG
jgi:hypothetical protein